MDGRLLEEPHLLGELLLRRQGGALRVKAKPEKSEYHEWLTYEFTERKPDSATAALKWEDLQLPFTITVDDVTGLYVANLRRELRSSPGLRLAELGAAAQYCLQNKTNLEEALSWAEKAAHGPGIGQENFTTLTTLAELQDANGKAEEARRPWTARSTSRTTGRWTSTCTAASSSPRRRTRRR